MNATNLEILEALETLAAAFPWDQVEINVIREPEGGIHYYAWLRGHEKYGFEAAVTSGDSAAEAVSRIIEEQQGKRDPDKRRREKIQELREQIEKLEAVVIGLPPYKPNRELAQINLPKAPAILDV